MTLVLYFLFIILIFSAPIAYKNGLDSIPPIILAFYRQLGATPILEIIGLFTEGVFPHRKDFIWFALIGISGIFVNQTFYILSIYYSGALLATILQLLATPLTAGLAILIKLEKFSIFKILGISCSVIGAALMAGLSGLSVDKSKLTGMILAIVQAFFVAFFVVFSKKKLLSIYPSITVTAGIHVASLPFMTITCFILQRDFSKYVVTKEAALPILYSVLFHSVAAYLLLMFVNSRLDASMVSAFGTLNPLFGCLLSVLILKEKFELKDILGGLLILSGLSIVVFQRLKESKKDNSIKEDEGIDLEVIKDDDESEEEIDLHQDINGESPFKEVLENSTDDSKDLSDDK